MAVRAGARCSPIAGGAFLPASGPVGSCDCRLGGGPGPPTAGCFCSLFASQRAGCSSRLMYGPGLGAPRPLDYCGEYGRSAGRAGTAIAPCG